MHVFLTTLHVLACIILVLVVLLQRGKGADMGAMLGGGGSNTVFGARGAGNFLTKITAASAVIFMLTSLSLSYLGTTRTSELLFDETVEEEPAPATSDLLEEVDDATSEEGEPQSLLEELPPEGDPAGAE